MNNFAWFSKLKRVAWGILICVCFNSFAVAQKHYYSWDFSDCEIKDILYAISLDTGISIVPDDTVSGKGDLKFAGNDFYVAFESFLESSRLYVSKNENVWTVSRFCCRNENGLYDLDVCDLTPIQIVEKISKMIDTVLTFDVLPSQKISVHFRNLDETSLIESLCKRFGNYEITKNNVGFHIIKKNEVRNLDLKDSCCLVSISESGFEFDLKNCYFSEVVEKLFEVNANFGFENDFCLLNNGEVKLQRSKFSSADLTDALRKICYQCGFSFVKEGELYYIFLAPECKNSLISGEREWKMYTLDYTKPQNFFSILSKRIGKVELVEMGDSFSFFANVTEDESQIINELIKGTDCKQSTYLITLKYLKPDELMNKLPPSVDKSGLFLSDDAQSVFFKGTEKAYKSFLKDLEVCDRPVTRLSYDLLILQYDETAQNLWSSSFDCKKLTANSRNSLTGVLGSVMGLNLNVISAFGLNFAMELQSSIEENNTKVYADTTLHGISGKQINFQNTNTYRYRDNNVNPETGVAIYSGVTREIVSGIKLDILGWVSGDGVITSKVTASVSRQGNDSSSVTGNPPPTSEKIITTEVSGRSGEPVVLSGLIQVADTNQEKRTPLVSKIPLLGGLFKNKSSIKENLQMIIYLVPHIEGEQKFFGLNDEQWAEKRISDFTEKFVVMGEKNEQI